MTGAQLRAGRRLIVRAMAAALVIAVVGSTSAAWAQSDTALRTRTYRFEIPVQRLDGALARVSQVSGVQMLYDSELATGRQSTAISGDFTVQEALVRLLAGTGLRARFTSGGSIVITLGARPDMTLDMLDVRAAPLVGNPPPDPRALAYVELVQRDIIDRLKADSNLSAGEYRISVRLWLDERGRVTRSEIISSSGDDRRDQDFSAALRNMRISQSPPEALPQPLRIEFRVR
jgi:TonB family protein